MCRTTWSNSWILLDNRQFDNKALRISSQHYAKKTTGNRRAQNGWYPIFLAYLKYCDKLCAMFFFPFSAQMKTEINSK